MPGMESRAPERTETRSGFSRSPNFAPTWASRSRRSRLDLRLQGLRVGALVGVVIGADLRRDRESGGTGRPMRHISASWPLAADPDAEGDDDMDPRWELVHQLLQYKKFKEAAPRTSRRLARLGSATSWSAIVSARPADLAGAAAEGGRAGSSSGTLFNHGPAAPRREARGRRDPRRDGDGRRPDGVAPRAGCVTEKIFVFSHLFDRRASRCAGWSPPSWRSWSSPACASCDLRQDETSRTSPARRPPEQNSLEIAAEPRHGARVKKKRKKPAGRSGPPRASASTTTTATSGSPRASSSRSSGGSAETHERMTETVVKTFEELKQRGKKLNEVRAGRAGRDPPKVPRRGEAPGLLFAVPPFHCPIILKPSCPTRSPISPPTPSSRPSRRQPFRCSSISGPPGAGPARPSLPILDELAGEFDGKLTIAKVNIDDNEAIAAEYGIRAIPTMLLFKGGQGDRYRSSGILPEGRAQDEAGGANLKAPPGAGPDR
jgi:hypothetical protein